MQLGLISNNVKGPQSYKKWFEYLKNKSGPNDILFLQETHSMKENEIRWNNDFKSEMHYSHRNLIHAVLLVLSLIVQHILLEKSDKFNYRSIDRW